MSFNLSKETVKRIPISIGGIILAITAMGNLFHDFLPFSRELCGSIAVIMLLFVVVKIFLYPELFKEDLNNPILASVVATCSMTLMLLADYIEPYTGYTIAICVWFAAIIIHMAFLVNYMYKFSYHFDLSNYTAGSFVVFAGVQMIGITAPVFNMQLLGTIAFWFSFICVCAVFIIVCYRYLSIPVPEQAKPILGVYAAPFSLCAVSYIACVSPKSFVFVVGMFLLTKILYVMVLVKLFDYLRKPFYPTFAGYTFPVIINTTTTLQTMKYLASFGYNIPFLHYELYVEIIIGLILVVYVLVNYLRNILIYD